MRVRSARVFYILIKEEFPDFFDRFSVSLVQTEINEILVKIMMAAAENKQTQDTLCNTRGKRERK